VTSFIAFAMFAYWKTSDDAAGAIDRGSIVRCEDETERMQSCYEVRSTGYGMAESSGVRLRNLRL
jgi:hypothetical protein